MKKISAFLSVAIILGVVFYALTIISHDNMYTSVRKYLKPKEETQTGQTLTGAVEQTQILDTLPPVITFKNIQNNTVVSDAQIDVQVEVQDNVSSPETIQVTGTGVKDLKLGYNPIVVSATDEAGNTGISYILIERK